jgi:hypothetical protein
MLRNTKLEVLHWEKQKITFKKLNWNLLRRILWTYASTLFKKKLTLFTYIYCCFVFIIYLIWFVGQFWHQVVPGLSRSQLREIKLWSSLPNSTPITTEPTNDWYFLLIFETIIKFTYCPHCCKFLDPSAKIHLIDVHLFLQFIINTLKKKLTHYFFDG